MKVLSVVGARPQFVKLAPVAAALREAGDEHVILHTGQHYDADLSDVFFAGLSIPDPDVHLGVGSGTHGVQTGAILGALDPILDAHRPDWVLVYGDTNSTLAATLAAVKMHLPVAHLEAGLRSGNRRMPEEHNRVLTDHAADLLLAPTEVAMGHLRDENLAERSVLVGDVMVDVCLAMRDRQLRDGAGGAPAALAGLLPSPDAPYMVATLHRPYNTDDPARLEALLAALAALPTTVVLLAHPRLVAKAAAFGLELERGSLRVGRPLGYADMVAAVLGSSAVVTDSGGLQKEAFLLERPCTTIRPETEWVETLEDGWNVLTPDPHLLAAEELGALVTRAAPSAAARTPYGDGRAAQAVVRELARRA